MSFISQFIDSIFDTKNKNVIFETPSAENISKEGFLIKIIENYDWISNFYASEEIELPGRATFENVTWLFASIAAGKTIAIVADDNAFAEKGQEKKSIASEHTEANIDYFKKKFRDNAHHSKIILTTSGTTGEPKKIHLNFTSVCQQAVIVSTELGISSTDRQLFYMPLNYVYGLSVALTGILRSSVLVETAHTLEEAYSFFEQIIDKKITCFSGVPLTYNLLVKKWGIERIKKSSLRMFTQAGGVLGQDVKNRILDEMPNKNFWVMYGQTELGGRITQFDISENRDKINSVGKVIEGVELYIKHDGDFIEGQPIGEVFVYSNTCAINSPDVAETIERGGKTFIATGDTGYLNEGYLYIIGRNKYFVKVAGTRISLMQVENHFTSLPDVTEAVVEYVDRNYPLLLIGISFNNTITNITDQHGIKSLFKSNEEFMNGLITLIRNTPYFIYIFDGEIPRLSSNKKDSEKLKERLRVQHQQKESIYIRL
jgi:acyl-CoA synthetase (AMP-forming)/AMP-acid ligase II